MGALLFFNASIVYHANYMPIKYYIIFQFAKHFALRLW